MYKEIFSFENGKIDFQKSSQILMNLNENYIKLFEFSFPSIEIQEFFEDIQKIIETEMDSKKLCKICAKYISEYFNRLFTKYEGKQEKFFGCCVELYICFLRCFDENIRYMLAFDNFERFIGTCEIYSRQLTDFVRNLRTIQNSISSNDINLSKYFQIVIFMRNTSTRMFNTQQIAELFPYSLDLSEWFQISKILEKKIKWYDEQKIEIIESSRMLNILNDIGGGGGEFRGLRSKLNMLFNNDKRVIVIFLAQVLSRAVNQDYLIIYDFFKENKTNITPRFARFAARVIIFRLVLNELRNDGFFKHIVVQKNNKVKDSLGYARKILSILYDFKLQNDDSYMSYLNMIQKFYANVKDAEQLYFNENNEDKREIISQVLYYMNYYDGRTDNWLQFIDIQYNIPQVAKVNIENYKELKEIIDNNFKEIKIRITSAGMAYLFFVVYSFEYFSCKSIYSDKKRSDYGLNDFPPLLCTIPSEDEILYKNYNELTCMKVLKLVSYEATVCIDIMKQDKNSIMFRKKLDESYISHKDRIINSQCGYIDNFVQCIKEIYKERLSNDQIFERRFKKFVDKVERIKYKYVQYR